MGHSDIGVTLNTYTHLGLENAQDELGRIAEIENARREMDKLGGEKTQEMFRVMGVQRCTPICHKSRKCSWVLCKIKNLCYNKSVDFPMQNP